MTARNARPSAASSHGDTAPSATGRDPMSEQEDLVNSVLRAVFEQVPAMRVKAVTFSPHPPARGRDAIARIDVADGGHILCEIRADGRLQSARVIED